jgi:hypothetical protein
VFTNLRSEEAPTSNSKFSARLGPVYLAYNPSYSACFFSRNSIFLSKKSANSVFQPAYNPSRTTPKRSQVQPAPRFRILLGWSLYLFFKISFLSFDATEAERERNNNM